MEDVRTQASLSEPVFLKVGLSEIPAENFAMTAEIHEAEIHELMYLIVHVF